MSSKSPELCLRIWLENTYVTEKYIYYCIGRQLCPEYAFLYNMCVMKYLSERCVV